jgi:hypothetical protein
MRPRGSIIERRVLLQPATVARELGLRDLIALKHAAGRSKDLDDATALEAILKEDDKDD